MFDQEGVQLSLVFTQVWEEHEERGGYNSAAQRRPNGFAQTYLRGNAAERKPLRSICPSTGTTSGTAIVEL